MQKFGRLSESKNCCKYWSYRITVNTNDSNPFYVGSIPTKTTKLKKGKSEMVYLFFIYQLDNLSVKEFLKFSFSVFLFFISLILIIQ